MLQGQPKGKRNPQHLCFSLKSSTGESPPLFSTPSSPTSRHRSPASPPIFNSHWVRQYPWISSSISSPKDTHLLPHLHLCANYISAFPLCEHHALASSFAPSSAPIQATCTNKSSDHITSTKESYKRTSHPTRESTTTNGLPEDVASQ